MAVPTILKSASRELRKNQTDAEKILWRYLRAGRFFNYKFRRQKVLGTYIVDFYCAKAKLIIELDGQPHMQKENINADRIRTEYLNSCGYNLIRFWNSQVFENINIVLNDIAQEIVKKH